MTRCAPACRGRCGSILVRRLEVTTHTAENPGATAQPDVLVGQLWDEVRSAARTIRKLSAAECSKRGICAGMGEMTVAEVLESFIVHHAEEHLVQVQSALRS